MLPWMYYFRSGALLKACFDDCVEQTQNLNGEYYASLGHKPITGER